MVKLLRIMKEIYAAESGVNIDDPNFWEKINEYAQKNADEENLKETEICPHCGQEI